MNRAMRCANIENKLDEYSNGTLEVEDKTT